MKSFPQVPSTQLLRHGASPAWAIIIFRYNRARSLAMLTAADVMTREVITVKKTTTIRELAELFR